MRLTHKVLAFLILSALTLACAGKSEEASKEVDPVTVKGDIEPTTVTTGKASYKTFEYLVNTTGKIEAAAEVQLVVQQNGYIRNLSAKEGQVVNQGQLIATIDAPEALLAYEKAKIALASAELEFENEKFAFTDGDLSTESLAARENNFRLKSGLKAAEISMKEAELALEKTKIYAPITGKIADLSLKPGSLVNSGDKLCFVISNQNLILKAKVLEADINQIKIGYKAEIFPVTAITEPISATVSSINPKVDENGMVSVTLQVSNNQALLPGMNARAIIKVPRQDNLIVPKSAVVIRSGRSVVFKLVNGVAKWNYVVTGLDNGQEVELLEFDQIKDGDVVITSNNLQIANDAPVKVIN